MDFACQMGLRMQVADKQAVTVIDHLRPVPALILLLIDKEHQVQVTAHHHIGVDVDAKPAVRIKQPLFDPVSAMLEGTSGQRALGAENGQANATVGAMLVGRSA